MHGSPCALRDASSSTRSALIVANGTSHGSIAKLIQISTGRKLLSFSIGARKQAGVTGIPNGSYRLIFALGDRLYAGSDRLETPEDFESVASAILRPLGCDNELSSARPMFFGTLSFLRAAKERNRAFFDKLGLPAN